jgi:hypothetical protein
MCGSIKNPPNHPQRPAPQGYRARGVRNTRENQMTKLPYSVECKSTYPFFERIAAFDVGRVALAYAEECASTNPQFEYRVMYRGKQMNTK